MIFSLNLPLIHRGIKWMGNGVIYQFRWTNFCLALTILFSLPVSRSAFSFSSCMNLQNSRPFTNTKDHVLFFKKIHILICIFGIKYAIFKLLTPLWRNPWCYNRNFLKESLLILAGEPKSGVETWRVNSLNSLELNW